MKNPNQPCDVRISFSGGQSVTIEKLSEQQQLQLSELLQASGVHYQWQAWLVRRSTIGGRLGALWRRFATWAMPLLLLGAMSLVAFAQEMKRVEPIRIALQLAEEKQSDREFDGHLREELNRRRDVVISSRRRDYDIWFVTAPITEGDRIIGYGVAVLVVTLETGRFKLLVETGPQLSGIAARVASKIDAQVFQTIKNRR